MAYDRKSFDDGLDRELKESIACLDAHMYGSMRVPGAGPQFVPIGARWVSQRTNEDRLIYYRSHGLDRCDDYPGGDAQFEQDVLSGEFHEFGSDGGMLGKEDPYIVDRMSDGRFRYDYMFPSYGRHPVVMRTFEKFSVQNGFVMGNTGRGCH